MTDGKYEDMKSDIGRRVVGLGSYCDQKIDGLEGVIVAVDVGWGRYGVRFDKSRRRFHDLQGLCEQGYGFWCRPSDIKFIDNVDYSVLGSLDALLL